MTWNDIHLLDQHITLKINGWHSAFSDKVWAFFSDIPVWIPLYALIVAFIIWRLGWKKGLIVVAAALATFGFCDQFSNLIKNIVCRVRPLNDEFMLANGLNVLEWGGGYSFFSAHAANVLGLATSTLVGLREDKRMKYYGYAAFMFTWAVLVSVSRIFVGRHYFGDVLTGAVIGAAAGLAFGFIARLAIRRFLNKRTNPVNTVEQKS